MKIYKFNCTVLVRGESLKEALIELHDEVDYHFGRDNNLISLESDSGVYVEEEEPPEPEHPQPEGKLLRDYTTDDFNPKMKHWSDK
jgi:hypothetical protein